MRDVRVSKEELTVYLGPGEEPPPNQVMDLIGSNTSRPTPPTMVILRGEVYGVKAYELPVRYRRVSDADAPTCRGWVQAPAYLLHVRYANNIWHNWNEGLMGAFQTMRELGWLPLAQVDSHGHMRPVTEGAAARKSAPCGWTWEPARNRSGPAACELREAVEVEVTRCDDKNTAWCREGIVSYAAHVGRAPVLLGYTGSAFEHPWRHMYEDVTPDLRLLDDLDGHCFKKLVLGKTSTLNFYQINDDKKTDDHMTARFEATSVFKAFAHSTQRFRAQAESARNPGAQGWWGYEDRDMERLRQGIGPEDMALVKALSPKGTVNGLQKEELDALKRLWEERHPQLEVENEAGAGQAVQQEAQQAVQQAVQQKAQQAGQQEAQQVAQEDAQQEEDKEREEDAEDKSAEAVAARRMRRLLADGGSGREGASGGRALDSAEDSDKDSDEEEKESERESARELVEHEVALGLMPRLVPGPAQALELATPRPRVTYFCRNFYSRGVLNEAEVLRWVLARYNVTLHVTTFEEPLLELMELLGDSDVVFGMHGAGWTNGLWTKPRSVAVQMYPYGWRMEDGQLIRGSNYGEIIVSGGNHYLEWVNPKPEFAFFRRGDARKSGMENFSVHPLPDLARPKHGKPGNLWVYQNTYVDLESFGPVLDQAMSMAGIKPVEAQQAAETKD